MMANKNADTLFANQASGLSVDTRRLVCVHEAGHAVIFALGGYKVWRVAVAPVGATDWEIESRKGLLLSDLWGVCEKYEDHPARRFLKANGLFDRQEFRDCLAPFPEAYRRKTWRKVRAHLCAAVAGELAEHLYLGTPPTFDFDGEGDGQLAAADDCLLNRRNTFEQLIDLTIRKLQSPDAWKRVIKLADALELSGCVEEGIEAFLPAPETSWPTRGFKEVAG